jgi:putative transposase
LALLAGTDFFTAEVLTLRGLMTYYVLFFIHLESRRVDIAGVTIHPNEPRMKQMARNVTMEGCGILRDCRYLLHDHDTKFTQSFQAIIASGQVEPLALPARSPNLNAYAERWVRLVKEEILCRCSGRVIPVRCNPTTKRYRRALSKVILFGERSLRRALSEYVDHYHEERNHQGKDNVLLFPRNRDLDRERCVQCRERLGGLLRYYHQEAA